MASVEDENKGKSGLLSRWFRGGDAATAPVEAPLPAASEAEPRASPANRAARRRPSRL